MTSKNMVADLLFGVQIVGAFTLCGSQFFRLLHATNGQLLSLFLTIEGFLVLHLLLAIGAHRAKPSRVTVQSVWAYSIWLALFTTNIVAIMYNGSYRWGENDTRVTVLSLTGAAFVLALMKLRGVGISDPMPKSLLAMVCKTLPQFIMAIEVAQKGGSGVPMLAVIGGNITILSRLGQIGLSLREAGWDRHRLWLGASELMNEISWATVTIVWFLVR